MPNMASESSIVPANKINKDQFETLLSQYPNLIKSTSESKGGKSSLKRLSILALVTRIIAKDGQKTLQELDDYRYDEALRIFSVAKPQRPMNLDDVKALVEWKL